MSNFYEFWNFISRNLTQCTSFI